MSRMAVSLALLLLSSPLGVVSRVSAQATRTPVRRSVDTLAVADSVRALAAYLTSLGQVTSALRSFLTRSSVSATATSGCGMRVARASTSSVSAGSDTVLLQLGDLDPRPFVSVDNALSDLYSVAVETSLGDSSIAATIVSGADKAPTLTSRGWPRVQLRVQSRARAESLATRFGAVIAACGGQPMSPELLAYRRAPRDIVGNLMSDSGVARAKATCRALVTETLRSPGSARFTSDSLTIAGWTPSTGQMVVTGDVDAQNGFGAMIHRSFICTLSRDGTAWLPVRSPLLF